MGKKGKSGSEKKKQAKKDAKNLNAQNLASLNRLATALNDLNVNPSSSVDLEEGNSTSNDIGAVVGLPLNHWKELPENVAQAYKMLSDGAEVIKATSTKYTLLGKINLEDGSKYADELRQGCELVATSALLLHQAEYGCSRATRKFVKQTARAIVARVISLVESFVSLTALEANVGAQNTGAVWEVCDEAISKIPKGNRVSMRRELFTWVRECNETMEEFQEVVDSSVDGGIKEEDEDDGWDDFCESTGHYDPQELPVARSVLALIKCTRGTLGLVLKAMESAGAEAEEIQDEAATSSIYQWMSDLHEMSRKAGEDVTDLGMLLYPPINFDVGDPGESNDQVVWERSEIGRKIALQRDCLLGIIQKIQTASHDADGEMSIQFSGDVLEMGQKLSSAVVTRSSEAGKLIESVVRGR